MSFFRPFLAELNLEGSRNKNIHMHIKSFLARRNPVSDELVVCEPSVGGTADIVKSNGWPVEVTWSSIVSPTLENVVRPLGKTVVLVAIRLDHAMGVPFGPGGGGTVPKPLPLFLLWRAFFLPPRMDLAIFLSFGLVMYVP